MQAFLSTAQVDPTGSLVMALLDFGDLSETYAVAEVAIALTYTLLLAMRLHEQKAEGCSDGLGRKDSGSAGSCIGACSSDDGGLEAAFQAGKLLLVSVYHLPPLPPVPHCQQAKPGELNRLAADLPRVPI